MDCILYFFPNNLRICTLTVLSLSTLIDNNFKENIRNFNRIRTVFERIVCIAEANELSLELSGLRNVLLVAFLNFLILFFAALKADLLRMLF
jgi:hypothetical protein